MLIIESSSLDVFFNLALEDYLLDEVERRGRILFLYRNRDAVVIGKNQNPWRECDVPRLREDGVALARRVSGGGTVYHDEGNLNYSILLPRQEYDLAGQFKVIQSALLRVGVAAVRSGTHSLTVAGRKFSGNAFCLRRNASLHHGTLLVDADLHRLARYLNPAVAGIETKAVASVPAQVVNLREVVPALTATSLVEALIAECVERYGSGRRIDDRAMGTSLLASHEAKLRSWEWVYGYTPRFQVEVAGQGRMDVDGGVIASTGERFNV